MATSARMKVHQENHLQTLMLANVVCQATPLTRYAAFAMEGHLGYATCVYERNKMNFPWFGNMRHEKRLYGN